MTNMRIFIILVIPSRTGHTHIPNSVPENIVLHCKWLAGKKVLFLLKQIHQQNICTMDIQNCIQFTNENPICFLATVENNKPKVRAMGFWFADATGFYFQSGANKDLYHQLKLNPNAEICFYKSEKEIGTMLRINGEVEFVDDRILKEKALNDRPFLKTFGLTVDSPGLIIFRIAHGSAHFWTMENTFKPKEIITF